MSARIKDNAEALCFLTTCNARQKNALLQSGNNSLIDSISESALNLLRGHVRLDSSHKKKLSNYKTQLRSLADKKIGRRKKRLILTQRGGLVGAILTPLLSTLVQLLVQKTTKKNKKKKKHL